MDALIKNIFYFRLCDCLVSMHQLYKTMGFRLHCDNTTHAYNARLSYLPYYPLSPLWMKVSHCIIESSYCKQQKTTWKGILSHPSKTDTHCRPIFNGLFIQSNSIKGAFTCQQLCFADPELGKFFSLRNAGQDVKYFIRKYTLEKEIQDIIIMTLVHC